MNIEATIRAGWTGADVVKLGHNGDDFFLLIEEPDESEAVALMTREDVTDLFSACIALLNAFPEEMEEPVGYYPTDQDLDEELPASFDLEDLEPEPMPKPQPKRTRSLQPTGKTLAEALADGSINAPAGEADTTVGEVRRR